MCSVCSYINREVSGTHIWWAAIAAYWSSVSGSFSLFMDILRTTSNSDCSWKVHRLFGLRVRNWHSNFANLSVLSPPSPLIIRDLRETQHSDWSEILKCSDKSREQEFRWFSCGVSYITKNTLLVICFHRLPVAHKSWDCARTTAVLEND